MRLTCACLFLLLRSVDLRHPRMWHTLYILAEQVMLNTPMQEQNRIKQPNPSGITNWQAPVQFHRRVKLWCTAAHGSGALWKYRTLTELCEKLCLNGSLVLRKTENPLFKKNIHVSYCCVCVFGGRRVGVLRKELTQLKSTWRPNNE